MRRRSHCMKKLIGVAGLALAMTGLAAPAHAVNGSDLGSGIGVSDDWDAGSAATCLQEVAVAPVLGDHVGAHADHCTDGSLITGSK
ncbi:hypothetical protein ACIRJS_23955 [Streptomyces sp. NPDC102340]|uniref:hypothetical protein n=2 Tax=unclassified Streptomyces TaxID=2593676 RepID=UPI00381F5D88